MSSDQRTAPRSPLEVEITFTSEHNFYTGFTLNVSGGGVFVATHQLAPVGSKISVKFTLPGLEAQPIECDAEVRWLRETHPTGMGLRFLNLTPQTRQAIDEFIVARGETIFFEE
jgi:uncharacterized protein (TIGR02266 family)